MSSINDLTGRKFRQLLVIKRAGSNKRGNSLWICLCDCGQKTTVEGNNLLSQGGTKSCGCLLHKLKETCKNGHDLSLTRRITHSRTYCCECNRNAHRRGVLKKHGLIDDPRLHSSCAICGQHINLRLDHDHVTGLFRNVLCNKCNLGLGQFDDDITKLQSAIKYLKKHKEDMK